MEKYRLTLERNGSKDAQNDKTIINTIYEKPDFPIIEKNCQKIVMYMYLIQFFWGSRTIAREENCPLS